MSNPKRSRALSVQPAPWSGLVLVCGKCLKRQDREELRGDLRKALKHAGRKDVRVVLSGCLDLCPKDGVALARGTDLAASPARLHVFDAHGPVDELARWVLDARL